MYCTLGPTGLASFPGSLLKNGGGGSLVTSMGKVVNPFLRREPGNEATTGLLSGRILTYSL